MPNNLPKEFELINGIQPASIDDIDPDRLSSNHRMSCADPAVLFNGRNLRLLRRSRGLSQMELSDLLGVTQPNVSRWEAGFEKTPTRMCERIREIMLGGNIDRGEHLARLVSSDPDLTITHLHRYSLPIVQLSRYEAGMLSQHATAYTGKDYRRVFRTEWFDEVFQNRALSDYALVNVHHDLIPDEPNPRIPAIRAHSSLSILHPVDGTSVIIAKSRYSDIAGAPPRIGHAITNDELFNRF